MANIKDVAKQLEVELPERIKKALAKNALKASELADVVDASPSRVERAINKMRAAGMLIVLRPDGKYDIQIQSAESGSAVHQLKDRGDGWIVFGAVADNHMCSKHERLDVLNSLYDIYEQEGVKVVYNAGNWIDGEARFNRHELKVFGMQAQIEYWADRYPERKGMTTYYVAGDDHEGWYQQRECVNVGEFAQAVAEKGGRKDLRYLGYIEADISLGKWERPAVMRVMHAGGGSAYAHSYTSQKIVESFQGGEKPAVLLIGHYHKWNYDYPRNVHAIQVGTTQDQSSFMRKKKIEAHVGGVLVWMKQDKTDGHITRLRAEWIPYYDRGFYQRRFE